MFFPFANLVVKLFLASYDLHERETAHNTLFLLNNFLLSSDVSCILGLTNTTTSIRS